MSKENGEDLCINLMMKLLEIINSDKEVSISSDYNKCNCLPEMISTLINILRTDNRYKYSIILKTKIPISKRYNKRTTIDIDITDIIGSTIEIKDIFEIRIAVCSSLEGSKNSYYRFVYYPVLKVGDKLIELKNKKLNIECPLCIESNCIEKNESKEISLIPIKLIRNS
ncbi:MAG: hypothetical protein QXV42_01235 [Ignisphaera sp.]